MFKFSKYSGGHFTELLYGKEVSLYSYPEDNCHKSKVCIKKVSVICLCELQGVFVIHINEETLKLLLSPLNIQGMPAMFLHLSGSLGHKT